jgi:hypothetical protein
MAVCLLCLLRCYDRIVSAYDSAGKSIVQWLRKTVGQDPDRVVVLSTGESVPSSFRGLLPSSELYVYDDDAKTLLRMGGGPAGRLKPLPLLALRVGDQDLSEWIGDLRGAGPLMTSLTVLQIVRLWSLAHRVYVYPNTAIYAVTTSGEEIVTSTPS